MRVRVIQHVAFEWIGALEPLFAAAGDEVATTRMFMGESLPGVSEFDWLVVMGGPMGVHDGDKFPWIAEEKRLIKAAIDGGKLVLGICLGGQMIADVLGAKVTLNREPEVGWFPVESTEAGRKWGGGGVFGQAMDVFHWHWETFGIPEGAERLCFSAGCDNQAFALGQRVVGLQFHPEATPQSVGELIIHAGQSLPVSRYIQRPDAMMPTQEMLAGPHAMLRGIFHTMRSAAR
jgi:GMP synthase-like glutamine amidotransferase